MGLDSFSSRFNNKGTFDKVHRNGEIQCTWDIHWCIFIFKPPLYVDGYESSREFDYAIVIHVKQYASDDL